MGHAMQRFSRGLVAVAAWALIAMTTATDLWKRRYSSLTMLTPPCSFWRPSASLSNGFQRHGRGSLSACAGRPIEIQTHASSSFFIPVPRTCARWKVWRRGAVLGVVNLDSSLLFISLSNFMKEKSISFSFFPFSEIVKHFLSSSSLTSFPLCAGSFVPPTSLFLGNLSRQEPEGLRRRDTERQ